MEKRCAKFICSCFNSHNLIVRNISMAAKINMYKCFDLFLLYHHKTIANGVFIRDLCLLRENNIVDDDQDLTSTELTYMIDFLCTS